ncbi:2-dehydro-3-deoxygalactonokinase [Leisingera sp. McT4-56]|uniref:2-dehydro-3-deoxygalactonokinase n=1 Tax=Leisingera sp. McT4-56 TaxID=2881255 RepID=UPI001CF86449|nr:2-dehydro-3-deoxygalactonokinase [Leisingera sp. McT4-56]MCB4457446.1 2-dehydro-3-deoxygalactonokinase [Leisingera sp. McT4-56]
MQPPGSGASWLAANLDANTLTAWTVSGSTAGPAQVLQLPDSRPAALAAGLRQMLAGAAQPVVLGGSSLVPPQAVPAVPAELPLAATLLEELTVHALPGLCQPSPAGLMQGAAARLRGFLQLNPDWDGVICLPGAGATHWVQVSAKEAVSFQSALTGQLAAAVAQQMALAAAGDCSKEALAEAAADGIAKPELLAARLAALQAEAALGQLQADTARGRLWGLLLGAELAAARPYWLGQNAALLAEAPLQPLYAAALEAQGLPVTVADPSRMTLEGLSKAWAGN